MKVWVRKVEPPVGLNVSGVCVFSNLVSNHSDFLRQKRSKKEFLRKAVAQISCNRVFWYCPFIPSLANLEYEPQLSTNPHWSSCWGWRLVCWSYVPVARHPGQRPNFDWFSLIIIDYHWLSLIIIDYHWPEHLLEKRPCKSPRLQLNHQ